MSGDPRPDLPELAGYVRQMVDGVRALRADLTVPKAAVTRMDRTLSTALAEVRSMSQSAGPGAAVRDPRAGA